MTVNQNRKVVLSRVFNAPRELVFKAWTDPAHFGKWWGPQGFSLEIVIMDVRPGSMFLGCQISPDGAHKMWGKFAYRVVNPPEKLEFVQSFSDEEGNTIRAPFNPNWPLEILNIVTLEADGDRTKLTLQGGPLNASDEEQAAYDAMAPMAKQGLEGMLDQLAGYLDNQR